MSEAEARAWIAARWGGDKLERLERYVDLVTGENERQNLVARSTLDAIWQRHILDSAQLVPLAEVADKGEWIDIGSGAGFPAIVASILQKRHVVLIEPRRRRAVFLENVVNELKLDAEVFVSKAESVCRSPASVVSARAVAALDMLLTASASFADLSTLYLFPKGRSATSELVDIQKTWQGVFHVEQSITSQESHIVIAEKVRRR